MAYANIYSPAVTTTLHAFYAGFFFLVFFLGGHSDSIPIYVRPAADNAIHYSFVWHLFSAVTMKWQKQDELKYKLSELSNKILCYKNIDWNIYFRKLKLDF